MEESNFIDKGRIEVKVYDKDSYVPIVGASVTLYINGAVSPIENGVLTDSSGQVTFYEIATPPVEFSMEPSVNRPYSEYSISVTATGYSKTDVEAVEVFSGELSIQEVYLAKEVEEDFQDIIVPDITLFGDYPPKIAEDEIKSVNQSGEIVLSRVVVPETVVVHDGVPTDSTAKNYYVKYKDYIKNVASSEIYSTWPRETLKANILAIMSFTLNRVYTEWYRNKGYNFTITSSTAFDHKFSYGRTIFDSISKVVDEIFDCYLSRPNVKQPILAQYCDGQKVSCPKWMSQWGSKYLGDQNYKAIEILRYYYGDNMYINNAEQISGIPSSWPGNNLDVGSSGTKVRQLQEQLNYIGRFYSAIPQLVVDGIYGEKTAMAVMAFQKIFNLPQTGVTDFPTWYKISDWYVRLSGIAELM